VNGQRARLRINLSQREFEVEGSEAFVKAYVERFEGWLAGFDEPAGPAPTAAGARPDTAPRPIGALTFGELLHQLPRAATDVDRILLAGYFCCTRSADKSYSTGEANGLLTDQGVKVGNPSQCVRQNLLAKRVFKHQGRYRVSQTGIDHLRQLLGADLTA
jgi:hypothetical protein